MERIRTAVIGAGYLGRFHVEKLIMLPESYLVAVCDIDLARNQEISEKYAVATTDNYKSLIGKVDAVNIVTPTPSHFEIAKFFLEQGVHVFVEKPIATTVEQADVLIAIAKQKKRILQCGHIERFNPVLQFIRPQLSNPFFIESQRLAPFKVRGSDVSVVLDLMIHDIDIILSIVNSKIADIHATGVDVLTPFIDVSTVRITFENGCVALMKASRICPVATRQLRVHQQDAYFYADMHNNSCRIHKKNNTELLSNFEEKQLEQVDALKDEIHAFLNAIRYQKLPTVSGKDARDALAVAIQIGEYISRNYQESFSQSDLFEYVEAF